MISCQIAKELIEKVLDGTIDETERAKLEAHAETCPSCREELRRFEQVQEVIADAFSSQTEAAQAKAQIMAKLSVQPIPQARPMRYAPGQWAWARTAIAAGIMLAAGVSLGFVMGQRGRDPEPEPLVLQKVPMHIGRLEGTVLVKHDKSDVWQPLQNGAAVYLKDTFHSTPKSSFVLQLGEASRIEVNQNSMLALAEYRGKGGKTEFSLEQGECTASLQSPHDPFFIRTPHGRVEALGTEFTVAVTDE